MNYPIFKNKTYATPFIKQELTLIFFVHFSKRNFLAGIYLVIKVCVCHIKRNCKNFKKLFIFLKIYIHTSIMFTKTIRQTRNLKLYFTI